MGRAMGMGIVLYCTAASNLSWSVGIAYVSLLLLSLLFLLLFVDLKPQRKRNWGAGSFCGFYEKRKQRKRSERGEETQFKFNQSLTTY